jgi:hypothetical protein
MAVERSRHLFVLDAVVSILPIVTAATLIVANDTALRGGTVITICIKT